MTRTEKAAQWMEKAAADNAHGYDQAFRWGEKGDYDCSAAVITAWEQAGVPVKTKGATYTGNIYPVFTKNGFEDVTAKVNRATGSGMLRGDVLLAEGRHVAMHLGNGKEAEASINEKGKATGGKPGDQTGREFLVRPYRNYPWTKVLRYREGTAQESGKTAASCTVTAKNGLNIRKAPGVSGGTVIKAVPFGTVLEWLGKTEDAGGTQWLLVRAGSTEGWVSGKYIKKA